MNVIRLIVGTLFIALVIYAMILDAKAHGIYDNWLMPDQRGFAGKRAFSCCNGTDCAPRASRMTGYEPDGTPMWEVQFEGRWLRVPKQKVETNYDDAWDPGDHQSHACISRSGNIYCFRPGEWLQ